VFRHSFVTFLYEKSTTLIFECRKTEDPGFGVLIPKCFTAEGYMQQQLGSFLKLGQPSVFTPFHSPSAILSLINYTYIMRGGRS
jgi:hypothetical protein